MVFIVKTYYNALFEQSAIIKERLIGWPRNLIVAVYIDSLVMIRIEKSETNKKRALEI